MPMKELSPQTYQEEIAILHKIEEHPSSLMSVKHPNEDELELALDINPKLAANFKNLSETIQIFLIAKDPINVKHLKNPTEKVQKEVVAQDPHLIKYFYKKASVELRMQALENDPAVVQYFTDATLEELKYVAKRGEEFYLIAKNRTGKSDFYNLLYNFKFLI
jgi:hypothetical protein